MLIPLPFPFFAVAGLALSLYALFVEYHDELYPNSAPDSFTPLCDIEAIKASCSNVFAMPEGHLLSFWGIVPKDSILNVPNAALGTVFYCTMLLHYLLVVSGPAARGNFSTYLVKFMTVCAMSSSIWLASVLWRLRELCLLCISTHMVNSVITYRVWNGEVVAKNNKYISNSKKRQ